MHYTQNALRNLHLQQDLAIVAHAVYDAPPVALVRPVRIRKVTPDALAESRMESP